jgi:energy-coupling factor transporter ATP-binding protein EcfA2
LKLKELRPRRRKKANLVVSTRRTRATPSAYAERLYVIREGKIVAKTAVQRSFISNSGIGTYQKQTRTIWFAPFSYIKFN